jgi:uncharacterized protein
MIRRLLLNKIKRYSRSCLLLGPRQTGKSTLIQALSPEIEVNLADEETYIQFLSDPGRLKKLVPETAKSVSIDEVQRIPSILNTVQFLLDRRKGLRFFLTGSSARKLKRGGANLLPGRIITFELGPLTPSELAEGFNLQRALSLGLLPGIYLEPDKEIAQKLLRTYAITYLKEEIQAEALTRNLEGFSRFFETVLSNSGNFIDFTKYASQSGIERMTARRYFDVLADTLIIVPVEPFSKNSKRRLIQHPKHYAFDVGVLNGVLRNFEASTDRIGQLFEHLVLQCLRATAQGHDKELRFSTYRTEAGAEVDFIIETDKQTYAIEVKASRNVGAADLRGIKSFAEFFGKKHQSMVIYLGEQELIMDKIRVVPLEIACKIFEE